ASLGAATLYVAAAVRDNGGGVVIGAGQAPWHAAAARRQLEAAGLADVVEIRAGDARETLHDAGGDVDLVRLDASIGAAPRLALAVMKRLAPQLQGGAIALNARAEPDYLAWVRDPAHGFRSTALPLGCGAGTELSVKAA
ncbi:MAG TPA: class I SAM-dependent methyltransferase, partial [Dokdonella sp.]